MTVYHYLVAYDISSPSRLRRVHKICSNYGVSIQFSIFACQLSEVQLEQLKSALLDVISVSEDQVLFLKVKKVSKSETTKRVPGVNSIGRKIRWGTSRAIII